MKRYPVTQQAVAGVLKDAIRRSNTTATGVARALGRTENVVRRMVNLQRDVPVVEFIAIANVLGVKPSTLMARVERRLKR